MLETESSAPMIRGNAFAVFIRFVLLGHVVKMMSKEKADNFEIVAYLGSFSQF